MSEDKIEEIKARHESGASSKSHYTQAEVLEQLNYLRGLDQMHDKDGGWETQLTNIVWWADDLIKDGAPTPSVSPKVWDAFIVGDFDTTLGVATAGALVLLEEAIDDRATLLAEVERLREALVSAEAREEVLREALEKIRAVATEGGALDSRYRAIAENALGDADNMRRQR